MIVLGNNVNRFTKDIITNKSQIFEQASQQIAPNQLMTDPFDQYFDGLEDMLKTHAPSIVLTYHKLQAAK